MHEFEGIVGRLLAQLHKHSHEKLLEVVLFEVLGNAGDIVFVGHGLSC